MNDRTTPSIAIVIPYYQRERGLLRQCVQSILDQDGPRDFLVIVVDDSSPVPAQEELAELLPAADDRLLLIHQPNAGPGAARNKGLDNVPPGTRFVTFLDSDDQWTGPFLADAVCALEQGYDLFIGNSTRTGIDRTRFEWDASDALNIRAAEHPSVDAARDIYEYRGNFFDLLVRRSSIIGPTTLAYRFDRFPSVRFNPALFNGQDRLFKLTLGQHLQRVAFSPRLYAEEGEGVNIFDKSQWGSPTSLRLLSSYIRLSKCILAEIALSPAQRRHVANHLADSRRSFTASTLHLLKQRTPLDWRTIFATLREDPATAAAFLPTLFGILRRRTGNDQRAS